MGALRQSCKGAGALRGRGQAVGPARCPWGRDGEGPNPEQMACHPSAPYSTSQNPPFTSGHGRATPPPGQRPPRSTLVAPQSPKSLYQVPHVPRFSLRYSAPTRPPNPLSSRTSASLPPRPTYYTPSGSSAPRFTPAHFGPLPELHPSAVCSPVPLPGLPHPRSRRASPATLPLGSG